MRLCIDNCCARLNVNRNGFESIGNGELVECGMMGGVVFTSLQYRHDNQKTRAEIEGGPSYFEVQ